MKPPNNLSATANKETFTKKELLKECWTEQRSEITYRREREQSVFQLSATVWIALLGSLVVNAPTSAPFLKSAGLAGRAWMTGIVAIAAVLTNSWIRKQRIARARCEQALASIQLQSGCYKPDVNGDTVLPKAFLDDWRKDYNQYKSKRHSFKQTMSWFLPLVVVACLWSFGWEKEAPKAADIQPPLAPTNNLVAPTNNPKKAK